MVDLVHELLRLAVPLEQQFAVHDRHIEVASRKRAEEIYLLRVLSNVDEAAGTGEVGAEFRYVDVSLDVYKRQGRFHRRRRHFRAMPRRPCYGFP